MADDRRLCEHRTLGSTDPECRNLAVYRVSRPSRRHDAQDSCRRHLAATVDALAQGDTSLMLTISYTGGNR